LHPRPARPSDLANQVNNFVFELESKIVRNQILSGRAAH
jgi:hypothetical protein